MADLSVDTVQLVEVARRLTVAIATLELEADFTGQVAELVGEPHLASRVRSFASSWDDRRKILLERGWILSRSLDEFGRALQNLDVESGKAVTQPGSTP